MFKLHISRNSLGGPLQTLDLFNCWPFLSFQSAACVSTRSCERKAPTNVHLGSFECRPYKHPKDCDDREAPKQMNAFLVCISHRIHVPYMDGTWILHITILPLAGFNKTGHQRFFCDFASLLSGNARVFLRISAEWLAVATLCRSLANEMC